MDFMYDLDEFSTLEESLEMQEEMLEKAFGPPARAYVGDRRSKRWTPADVKELPGATVYAVDMPGIKPAEINVHVEDGKVLVVNGERKSEDDKEAKYVKKERRTGRFARRFPLPESANLEGITAGCQDGVLTVTVEKKAPAEAKKRQTIEVKVG